MASLRAPRVLLVCGSSRSGSFNSLLLDSCSALLADHGAVVNRLDASKAESLPMFSEERERLGIPAGVSEMKRLFDEADGLLFASPEYNGSLSPLVCNTVTWMSRPLDGDEPMYASFKGKVGLVASASPGGLGGMRSLNPLRQLLTNLGVKVVPEQVAIGSAYSAFEEGKLVNEQHAAMLSAAVQRFFEESRSTANHESMCKLAHHLQGEYGEIVIPTEKS